MAPSAYVSKWRLFSSRRVFLFGAALWPSCEGSIIRLPARNFAWMGPVVVVVVGNGMWVLVRLGAGLDMLVFIGFSCVLYTVST
jgi:hypothetical protein